jgi:hypothetical protein
MPESCSDVKDFLFAVIHPILKNFGDRNQNDYLLSKILTANS